MPKLKLFIFLLLFIFSACSLPARNQPVPRSGSFTPISFDPPVPERLSLENGMIVHMLEDHELPLITVSVSIRTGAIYEPPGLAGLAALTGTVMRTGGTAYMSANESDRHIESMSAKLSVGIGAEQGSASLFVLKEDFEKAFTIFAQILMRPAFEEEKLLIARRAACQGLIQLPDNPLDLAFREYKKLIYADNPRRTLPSMASITRIRRSDLVEFHQRFFRPENIMIAVSGDFSRDAMRALLQRQLGSWPATGATVPAVAPPAQVSSRHIYHLQKQLSQSTIVMGHLAPPRIHPDYYAFQVLDFILGGGFTARLSTQIRTRQGLAYSVGSFYRADIDYGVFGAYSITRADATNRVLSLMFDILEQIKRGDITAEELELAREAILNNFIFSFTSSAQIAAQQMRIEFDGLPADFIKKAPEKIRAITLQDLKRTAEAWLHPDRMVVMLVGDKARFDVPLEAWPWGRVKTIHSDILTEK
ncbi:MAG: insulinase family protein [Deltaproteobacteria bacterium]|nr:insulinase family protein [Deltaproteobacteria bacterium]